MFNVKEWLVAQQKKASDKIELRKAQQFYKIVKAGSMFIELIQKDLAKQQSDLNRHERRRMEKDLNETGKLTPEIVGYYQKRIDFVLYQINQRLNPPKQPKVKTNPNAEVRTTPPNGYSPKPSAETGKIIPPQGGTGEVKRG